MTPRSDLRHVADAGGVVQVITAPWVLRDGSRDITRWDSLAIVSIDKSSRAGESPVRHANLVPIRAKVERLGGIEPRNGFPEVSRRDRLSPFTSSVWPFCLTTTRWDRSHRIRH